MRLSAVVLLSLALTAAYSAPQAPESLEIYAVDVEGGKATLVVSPSKESLLIDTGTAGEERSA